MRAPNMRMKSALSVAALVVALASALGACSSGGGPATDGPLSSGVDRSMIPRGAICAPGGELQTFGNQLFTNYGHVTVVLDRVTLLGPRNERLVGAYAVPGTLLIGTVPWPPEPSRGFPLPSTWKHRQLVHGFRLAPGKSFNMVLGVTAIGEYHRGYQNRVLAPARYFFLPTPASGARQSSRSEAAKHEWVRQ